MGCKLKHRPLGVRNFKISTMLEASQQMQCQIHFNPQEGDTSAGVRSVSKDGEVVIFRHPSWTQTQSSEKFTLIPPDSVSYFLQHSISCAIQWGLTIVEIVCEERNKRTGLADTYYMKKIIWVYFVFHLLHVRQQAGWKSVEK